MPKQRKYRAITYIDGFNLYHGIRDSEWRNCLWLDLQALSRHLLAPNNKLVAVKYFTARIRGAEDGDNRARAADREAKRKRQADYLEALQTLPLLKIYEGHYLPKIVTCNRCGTSWLKPEEKKTDVQMATQLVIDAYEDHFDTAMIVSGDGDITPPIEELTKRFPQKRFIAAFPPRRGNANIAKLTHTCFMIRLDQLRSCQLPNPVVKPDGHELWRPERWGRQP